MAKLIEHHPDADLAERMQNIKVNFINEYINIRDEAERIVWEWHSRKDGDCQGVDAARRCSDAADAMRILGNVEAIKNTFDMMQNILDGSELGRSEPRGNY